MVNDVFGLAGTTIDRRYRVDAAIGEGGFGVVYRGFHLAFKHAVAVKCLKLPPHFTPEAQALFVERFREEGAFLSKLSEHGSIVRVFDLDVTATPRVASVPYMVLEWLEGQELETQLEDRRARGQAPHTQVQATALLRPAIDAVALAHAHKIAHRDLKPANLYTAQTSKGPVIKVLDFGIAKAMQEGETATQVATRTSSGFSAFSPQYGAPEQFRAKRYGATGPWTDVHALGLMLTELVSGKRPIEGEEVADYYEAGTSERRPTPRARGAEVSDAFEAVCAKALALDPRARYQNAGELGLALDAVVEARDGEAEPPTAELPPAVKTQLAEPLAVDAGVNTVLAEPLADAPKTDLAEPLSPESASGKTVLAEPRVPPRSMPEPRSRTRLLPLGIGAFALAAIAVFVATNTEPPAGPGAGSTATSASAPLAIGSTVTSANVVPETTIAKGKRLFFDGSVRENASVAISLFRQACDGGTQAGCAGLAWAQQIGRGVPRDRTQAFRAADAACAQGSLFGCVVLGRSYALGSGVAKDAKRAVELFQKTCDGGELLGCSNLGMACSSGDGVAESRKRATELLHKACDGGVMAGCLGLAFVQHGLRNRDGAQRYYERACDGGELAACDLFASGLPDDQGPGARKGSPPGASARKVVLFQKACDGGELRGCSSLAFAYERGAGVAQDAKRARELYARVNASKQEACDAGEPEPCTDLGISYDLGSSVIEDVPRANSLFRRACNGGDMNGCVWLGLSAGDDKSALGFYQHACDGGLSSACTTCASWYSVGRGAAQNDKRAAELYQQACAAGDADLEACKAVPEFAAVAPPEPKREAGPVVPAPAHARP